MMSYMELHCINSFPVQLCMMCPVIANNDVILLYCILEQQWKAEEVIPAANTDDVTSGKYMYINDFTLNLYFHVAEVQEIRSGTCISSASCNTCNTSSHIVTVVCQSKYMNANGTRECIKSV